MNSAEPVVEFIRDLELGLRRDFPRVLPFSLTLIPPGFHTQIHKSCTANSVVVSVADPMRNVILDVVPRKDGARNSG